MYNIFLSYALLYIFWYILLYTPYILYTYTYIIGSFDVSIYLQSSILKVCERSYIFAHKLYWFIRSFSLTEAGVTEQGVCALKRLLASIEIHACLSTTLSNMNASNNMNTNNTSTNNNAENNNNNNAENNNSNNGNNKPSGSASSNNNSTNGNNNDKYTRSSQLINSQLSPLNANNYNYISTNKSLYEETLIPLLPLPLSIDNLDILRILQHKTDIQNDNFHTNKNHISVTQDLYYQQQEMGYLSQNGYLTRNYLQLPLTNHINTNKDIIKNKDITSTSDALFQPLLQRQSLPPQQQQQSVIDTLLLSSSSYSSSSSSVVVGPTTLSTNNLNNTSSYPIDIRDQPISYSSSANNINNNSINTNFNSTNTSTNTNYIATNPTNKNVINHFQPILNINTDHNYIHPNITNTTIENNLFQKNILFWDKLTNISRQIGPVPPIKRLTALHTLLREFSSIYFDTSITSNTNTIPAASINTTAESKEELLELPSIHDVSFPNRGNTSINTLMTNNMKVSSDTSNTTNKNSSNKTIPISPQNQLYDEPYHHSTSLLYIPLGNTQHTIMSILIDECFAFSTKERAPLFLCFEIIDTYPLLTSKFKKQRSCTSSYEQKHDSGNDDDYYSRSIYNNNSNDEDEDDETSLYRNRSLQNSKEVFVPFWTTPVIVPFVKDIWTIMSGSKSNEELLDEELENESDVDNMTNDYIHEDNTTIHSPLTRHVSNKNKDEKNKSNENMDSLSHMNSYQAASIPNDTNDNDKSQLLQQQQQRSSHIKSSSSKRKSLSYKSTDSNLNKPIIPPTNILTITDGIDNIISSNNNENNLYMNIIASSSIIPSQNDDTTANANSLYVSNSNTSSVTNLGQWAVKGTWSSVDGSNTYNTNHDNSSSGKVIININDDTKDELDNVDMKSVHRRDMTTTNNNVTRSSYKPIIHTKDYGSTDVVDMTKLTSTPTPTVNTTVTASAAINSEIPSLTSTTTSTTTVTVPTSGMPTSTLKTTPIATAMTTPSLVITSDNDESDTSNIVIFKEAWKMKEQRYKAISPHGHKPGKKCLCIR